MGIACGQHWGLTSPWQLCKRPTESKNRCSQPSCCTMHAQPASTKHAGKPTARHTSDKHGSARHWQGMCVFQSGYSTVHIHPTPHGAAGCMHSEGAHSISCSFLSLASACAACGWYTLSKVKLGLPAAPSPVNWMLLGDGNSKQVLVPASLALKGLTRSTTRVPSAAC